jgi:hypothetical protein
LSSSFLSSLKSKKKINVDGKNKNIANLPTESIICGAKNSFPKENAPKANFALECTRFGLFNS